MWVDLQSTPVVARIVYSFKIMVYIPAITIILLNTPTQLYHIFLYTTITYIIGTYEVHTYVSIYICALSKVECIHMCTHTYTNHIQYKLFACKRYT